MSRYQNKTPEGTQTIVTTPYSVDGPDGQKWNGWTSRNLETGVMSGAAEEQTVYERARDPESSVSIKPA